MILEHVNVTETKIFSQLAERERDKFRSLHMKIYYPFTVSPTQ